MTARAAFGSKQKAATAHSHAGPTKVARKRSARRSLTAEGSSRADKGVKREDGARVPSTPGNSSLDQFLRMMDDPDYWRTIPSTGQNEAPVKLTAEDLELIRRIEASEYGDVTYDPYEPAVDFFTATPAEGPIRRVSEPRRRLQPSRWEAARIRKILAAIRRGDLKVDGKSVSAKGAKGSPSTPNLYYDMWSGETDAAILARRSRHVEAPRLALPDHRESYNPPAEYLLTEEEQAAWKARSPEDRRYNYMPTRYGALRLVPAYGQLVKERFNRCLDLFLCPRSIKQKIQMHPDDLLPVLPDPRDLRPFPTARSIDFVGHTRSITSISIDPTGQWLVSADAAGSLRLWDAQTGHCRRTWNLPEETISSVAWNPNKALFMFAVAYGQRVLLIVPPECPGSESTRTTVEGYRQTMDRQANPSLTWSVGGNKGLSVLPAGVHGDDESIMVAIEHPARIRQVQWHRRGDYFATLAPEAPSGARVIHIHQLSRHLTQCPFNRMPGIARAIAFHPTHPQLVLATSKAVRIYDLTRRSLVKKLTPGANSLSELALHPTGDHILTASHDGALAWFDLDYSVRPYRVLSQHHGTALRAVACHATYPLVATGGDDGCIQVVHATVYTDDLTKSPLIVPVKTLRDWAQAGETPAATVTSLAFHPTQPWLFGSTSEGSLSLFV